MMQDLREKYEAVRLQTCRLCRDLSPEDTVLQAEEFTSPAKWHLAHSTWFFETFVLKSEVPGYREFNPDFHFLYNSYYETLGKRVQRNRRALSRPPLDEVYAYRQFVDAAMETLFNAGNLSDALTQTITLGLQHEQQHQELLVTDVKYNLAQNPLLPAWNPLEKDLAPVTTAGSWLPVSEGVYEIGYAGDDFCFDNELGVHKQYIRNISLAAAPVTNREYLEFIAAGGYQQFGFWLAEAWDWVQRTGAEAPLYWQQQDGVWHTYGFNGLEKVDPDLPVIHLSYYEADAFARWKGLRLPTEFEHETAAKLYPDAFRDNVWEWTQSAYLPYPGFQIAAGAVGEYNGKFMLSQMVLRGGSIATPAGHARPTYRNFFHPHLQWQFSGLRLAKDDSNH